MKKASLFAFLTIVALVLTACASANSGADPATGTGNTGSGSFSNSFRSGAGRALSADAKLALGTIKLEGTPQAIDAKTAAKLIPLWQLMVQLHSSSSTAPEEVTAVLNQIEATMAPQQVSVIQNMSFTSADVFALLQSEAQASGSSGTNGSSSNGSSNRNGGGRVFFGGPGPEGGFGGGAFGGGGFGGGAARTTNGNGTSSSSSTQLTAAQQAEAVQARENAISSLVENQLIRLLESKLGSQAG